MDVASADPASRVSPPRAPGSDAPPAVPGAVLRRLLSFPRLMRGRESVSIAAANGEAGSAAGTADSRVGKLQFTAQARAEATLYECWQQNRLSQASPMVQQLCEHLDGLTSQLQNRENQLSLLLEEEEKLVTVLTARSMQREAAKHPPLLSWTQSTDTVQNGATSPTTVIAPDEASSALTSTAPVGVPYKVAVGALREVNQRRVRLVRTTPGAPLGLKLRTLTLPRRDDDGNPRLVLQPGTFVAAIEPNSPAEQAGMRVGDQILEVDGVLCQQLVDEAVSAQLDANEGTITVLVSFTYDYKRVLHHRRLVDLTHEMSELQQCVAQLAREERRLQRSIDRRRGIAVEESSEEEEDEEAEEEEEEEDDEEETATSVGEEDEKAEPQGAQAEARDAAPPDAEGHFDDAEVAKFGAAPLPPLSRFDSEMSTSGYITVQRQGAGGDLAEDVQDDSGDEDSAPSPQEPEPSLSNTHLSQRPRMGVTPEVSVLRHRLGPNADLATVHVEDVCETAEELRAAMVMMRNAWQAERREHQHRELELRERLAELRNAPANGASGHAAAVHRIDGITLASSTGMEDEDEIAGFDC